MAKQSTLYAENLQVPCRSQVVSVYYKFPISHVNITRPAPRMRSQSATAWSSSVAASCVQDQQRSVRSLFSAEFLGMASPGAELPIEPTVNGQQQLSQPQPLGQDCQGRVSCHPHYHLLQQKS